MPTNRGDGRLLRYLVAALCGLAQPVLAAPPAPADAAPSWSRGAAIAWALAHNPELQTARCQRGIAAAGVVIARTYPFNPLWDFKVQKNSGPASAAITNLVGTEQVLLFEIELHHQKSYRKQGAEAALSRVECEIAAQELQTGVRTARAFDAVLYRQAKAALLEEALATRLRAVEQVRKKAAGDKNKQMGVLLAQVDVSDVRSQLVASRLALTIAQSDLAKALGDVHGPVPMDGALEITVPPAETMALVAAALATRPDGHAREAALTEADARWRLEIANRRGNPLLGTDYEYDPTRINFIGAHVTVPLPLCNTHKGEIQQREAERVRAAQELSQVQQQIGQEVEAAVARLQAAVALEEDLRQDLLPEIQADVAKAERLAEANKQQEDSAELTELRQRLLKSRDLYLDSLWEISQARADLAAAMGDLRLTTGPSPAP
jgi:cobalt-zinc-cadmium efflux system outer membrane protein